MELTIRKRKVKLIVIDGDYLIPVDEETGEEILIPDVVVAEEIEAKTIEFIGDFMEQSK